MHPTPDSDDKQFDRGMQKVIVNSKVDMDVWAAPVHPEELEECFHCRKEDDGEESSDLFDSF
jgi:hypothetical protein